VLVPFADSKAIANEVIGCWRMNPPACDSQERLFVGREMIWPNVAKQYMRSFEQARTERAKCRGGPS